VEHAAASEGDKGKAGVSGKVAAAGLGVAAAAAAAVVASKSGSKEETTEDVDVVQVVEPVPVDTVTPAPVTTTESLGTTTGAGYVGGLDPVEATAPSASPALDDVNDGREFGTGALVDDRDLDDDGRDRL